MALIDELFGRGLTQKEIARIKANPGVLKEVVDLYYADSEDGDATTTAAATTTATAASATPPSAFSLADIEGALDKRLGNLDERIKTTATTAIEDVIKNRSEELVTAATDRALRRSDELGRIYRRHEKEFGEEFDSTAFDKWASEQMAAGVRFNGVTNAYETWTADRRLEKKLSGAKEEGAREALKERANQMVPGVTPASARSPLSTFINRGKTTDSEGQTAAHKAGRALSERLAAKDAE